MIKLLVEDFGEQFIHEVHESGGYYDLKKILWDERTDGKFQGNTSDLGGFVKQQDGSLIVDSAKLATYQTAQQAKQQQESQRRTAEQQARQVIKSFLGASTLTAADIQSVVKALIVLFRDK